MNLRPSFTELRSARRTVKPGARPLAAVRSAVGRFRGWESLAALAVATAGTLLASRNFLRPDVVSGDAQVHHYWMRQFQDPQLFNDGLTAQLRASQRYPDGYVELFRLASNVVDPIAFGEYLGVALMALSGWLVWRIVRDHTSWLPAAWIAGGAFLALSDIHRFYGGFPRGFVHPVVLLTVLLAMRRRDVSAALIAAAASLFYPPAALLAVGVLAVSALGWRDRRPRLDARRAGLALLALALSGVLVAVPTLASGGAAETLTAAEARLYPEFGPSGNLHIFVSSPLEYLTQNRTGFDLRASGSILFLAAAALLLVRPANRRLLRREVWALPVVALAGYALAQLVLFKLYLPHRYTYPLLAFCAIAVGVLIRPTWQALGTGSRRWVRAFLLLCAPIALYYLGRYVFPLGPMRSLDRGSLWTAVAAVAVAALVALIVTRLPQRPRVEVAAALTGVALLGAMLSLPNRQPPGVRCAQGPVATFLRTLPREAVIAGDPAELNCIPLTARRAVVISTKLSYSYETEYFKAARARMFAMLGAYYGSSPRALVHLRRRYAATHLWIRPLAIRKLAERGGSRSGELAPYGEFIARRLKRGAPAVLHLPPACRRWTNGSNEVYDIRCIEADLAGPTRAG